MGQLDPRAHGKLTAGDYLKGNNSRESNLFVCFSVIECLTQQSTVSVVLDEQCLVFISFF